MNFKDALLGVELVIESGAVPLIIGESGIGKTALIKELCIKKDYYSIIIDGNMLKEGEIGGLPLVEDYDINKNGSIVRGKRTVYATHVKLQEIENVINKDKNKSILLFIDEINRCEHSVQQELMNIILNREINGYKLPDRVIVAAAMNPSSKYDEYSESEYQVVDMDPAQEDRFVWIEMESDATTWLDWGMEIQDGQSRIHQDILGFIASFPEYLHAPNSKEMVKATPRSWERVSNSYRVYLNKKKEIPQKIFFNVVKGNVGAAIAQEFIGFIENNKSPLITAKEIFSSNNITDEMKKRVKDESHSRLYMTSRNALNYLNKVENRRDEIKLFSEFIQLYPPDLKIAVMRNIRESYKDTLYKEFLGEKRFIDGYFETYSEIEG